MTLLIIYITIAIGVSFLCSILEAVVLSLSPAYLYTLKKNKPTVYSRLGPLTQNIEKPLGAILSLNTVAHTIGAAGAGAQAQKVYGNEFLTLFSILLTLAILVLSEIIPKSIGARYWKSLDSFAAMVLPPMVIGTYPLVWLTEKLSKIFKGKGGDYISREEVNAIAELALTHGSLEKSEYNFLKRLMKFRNVDAASIMTNVDDVYCLPTSMTVDEALADDDNHPFSRIPVFGVNKNDVKGYVLRVALLKAKAKGHNPCLSDLFCPMLIVTENATVRQLMFRLIERREHISGVINDEGDLVGILTLEDIIEALLGLEIVDESDPDFVKRT